MLSIGRAIAPRFRELDRRECEAILAKHSVGRLAFALHDRVDVAPLHYALVDGWIYGRTSIGSKLNSVAHNRWVAFEVDEVDGPFDWRSVVVHGGWYQWDTAPPAEQATWEGGIEALRRLVPGTLEAGDPVPFRTVVFRVHLAEVTGRECVSGRGRGADQART